MKLNLGTIGKVEGYTTVDIKKGADIKQDLTKFPWKFKDVEEIVTTHFIQELPLTTAIKFLTECHRVLKPGGKLVVNVPDFFKILEKYNAKDMAHFIAKGTTLESKYLWYLQWKGTNISFYCEDLLREILDEIGFRRIEAVPASNRPSDSVEIEAYK